MGDLLQEVDSLWVKYDTGGPDALSSDDVKWLCDQLRYMHKRLVGYEGELDPRSPQPPTAAELQEDILNLRRTVTAELHRYEQLLNQLNGKIDDERRNRMSLHETLKSIFYCQ